MREPAIDLRTRVQRVSGFPSFLALDALESDLLLAAGVTDAPPSTRARPSPTTFHIASADDCTVLGVACSTIGPLAELPLGLALAAASADGAGDLAQPAPVLPDPACELVSLAVDSSGAHGHELAQGVSEALYASFFEAAKAGGAKSLVVGLDPWLFDLIREEYGVPFQLLGPPIVSLGRELLPAGGAIEDLEAGVRAAAPAFAAYFGIA